MRKTTSELRYEDAARRVNITDDAGNVLDTGWQSIRSGHFFSDRSANAEHHARYQDATDRPCDGGCGGRAERGWTVCQACRSKADNDRWLKSYDTKAVAWDGKTPLATHDDDRFLWNGEEVREYVLELLSEGSELEDVRLVVATPNSGRIFEMSEFLCDDLAEDNEIDDREINKTVNDWIKSHAPFSWTADGPPVKVESLGIEQEDINSARGESSPK